MPNSPELMARGVARRTPRRALRVTEEVFSIEVCANPASNRLPDW